MIVTKYKEDEVVDYRRKCQNLPLVLSFLNDRNCDFTHTWNRKQKSNK